MKIQKHFYGSTMQESLLRGSLWVEAQKQEGFELYQISGKRMTPGSWELLVVMETLKESSIYEPLEEIN